MISDTIQQILLAYGKIGLLIDDASDAKLRTAREIYGSDGLPSWWFHCEDVESAIEALRAACEAVVAGNPSWAKDLPFIVVIDRYLKLRQKSRAVPWDSPSTEEARDGSEPKGALQDLQASMRRMLNAQDEQKHNPGRRRLIIAAVTSYFDPQEKERGIPWQPRHHEPLFQLRKEMGEELLSFGPSDVQHPKLPLSKMSQQDSCRRHFWDPTIDQLVQALHSNDRKTSFVLFTGAGASLANDRFAPGIPPTAHLLDWMSWDLIGRTGIPPSWPRVVALQAGQKPPTTKLSDLIAQFEKGHSAAEFEWTLEDLFDHDADKRALAGAESFRLALQRFDHGFPFHTWLLAQLPWTAILTANFDGIHERAAASAASSLTTEQARGVRRLGDIDLLSHKPSGTKRRVALNEFLKQAGLFKPYGSLTSIAPLALTQKDFWGRLGHVEKVLDLIFGGTNECWLVFLGYRLASSLLSSMIVGLLYRFRLKTTVHLVWVDPGCCNLNSHPHKEESLVKNFDRASTRKTSEILPHVFHPLPARALDFAYDLWCRYSRKRI